MSLLNRFYKIVLAQDRILEKYNFLYNFLNRIYNKEFSKQPEINNIENIFDEKLKIFIENNKEKLDDMLKWATKPPKEIGFGSDGFAYDIGNNKVLKLFNKEYAFLNSIKLVNDLFKNKHHASSHTMIFDADIIGDFKISNSKTEKIYYYIQEKVFTGNKNINKKIADLIEIIKDTDDLNIKQRDSIKKTLNSIFKDQEAMILKEEISKISIDEYIFLKNDWFVDLVKDTILNHRRYGLNFDCHKGNIGITDYGKIFVFDPYYKFI